MVYYHTFLPSAIQWGEPLVADDVTHLTNQWDSVKYGNTNIKRIIFSFTSSVNQNFIQHLEFFLLGLANFPPSQDVLEVAWLLKSNKIMYCQPHETNTHKYTTLQRENREDQNVLKTYVH